MWDKSRIRGFWDSQTAADHCLSSLIVVLSIQDIMFLKTLFNFEGNFDVNVIFLSYMLRQDSFEAIMFVEQKDPKKFQEYFVSKKQRRLFINALVNFYKKHSHRFIGPSSATDNSKNWFFSHLCQYFTSAITFTKEKDWNLALL